MSEKTSYKSAVVWFAVVLIIWTVGFFVFVHYVNNLASDDDLSADVIVVLTGDKGRVPTAAHLFHQETTARLFISGVGGGVELDALSGTKQLSRKKKESVVLGRGALNTRQNALETADFVKNHNVSSILLVTSYYHIPRSLVEFERVLPDVDIKLYPIKEDLNPRTGFKRYKLLMKEYNKFILAEIRALTLKMIAWE